MAVFDTIENQRTKYTEKTLESLFETVDFNKHRLIIVDNNSCEATKSLIKIGSNWTGHKVITNEKNIGTAEAVNLAWKERKPGEHCVKMDNDVVIHHKNWLDELEEAVKREPRIGQIGLKRKDLAESPLSKDLYFKSTLTMLPHKGGENWMIVEEVNHVMGTCVLHSSALLDKVGYLHQPHIYGFDDAEMSFRSKKAGFINCFLPYIKIDHIDTGENPYTQEKIKLAQEAWTEYGKIMSEYKSGKRSIYYEPKS